MMLTSGLSVTIPVYNSAEILPSLIERLSQALPNCADTYEVILVNDGSRDGSWEAIVTLANRYSFIRGIDLMRNFGQHNALLVGIRAARHDVIVTMDDDLQHPPEEIPKLLAELAKGKDLVQGYPIQRQHSFRRNAATRLVKKSLEKLLRWEGAMYLSAFRAFRTELRTGFAACQTPFASIDVLLHWVTTKISSIPVEHAPRAVGASGYSMLKQAILTIHTVTSFSTVPLRIASIVGFVFTLFGGIVLIYVIVNYLTGGVMPGFTFLASIVATLSGVQLFALGVIGEYLARMYRCALMEPQAVIRRTTD